jgi:photosystem II stability/assembly factor-like uncharacterized protein
MLIATDDEGILRSEDGGKTWQPANRGFCNQRFSPVWVVNGEVYTALDTPSRSGVFRLTGSEDSWEEIPAEARETMVPPLSRSEALNELTVDNEPALVPRQPSSDTISMRGNLLLRGGGSGLTVSRDQGRSWQPASGSWGTDTIQAICRHPEDDTVVFAAKYGIVYVSSDAGHSWKRISPENWPINSIGQLLIPANTPHRLIVLTHQQGIWAVSLDGNGRAESGLQSQ